jgi:hypothetical protein
LTIPAGGSQQTLVPLRFFGRGLYRARLSVVPSDGQIKPLKAMFMPLTATYARLPVTSAYVRADAIAYTMSVRDGMVDIHLRNLSHDTVHADIALEGLHKVVPSPLPRVHLLPGTTTELLVPFSTGLDQQALINDAILTLSNVRYDSTEAVDAGPTYAIDNQVSDPLLFPPGHYPVAVMGAVANSARFNPWVLSWQIQQGQLHITNRSDTLIAGNLQVRVGLEGQQHACTIAGNSTMVLAVSGLGGALPFVGLADPVLAGVPVPPPLTIAIPVALPEHALPVTPRYEDTRFSALSLVSTIERAGPQQAKVTFYNATGIQIEAHWSIAGYMNEGQSVERLRIPPGLSVALTVPVTKSDIRMALARVLVWDVHMGEDVMVLAP